MFEKLAGLSSLELRQMVGYKADGAFHQLNKLLVCFGVLFFNNEFLFKCSGSGRHFSSILAFITNSNEGAFSKCEGMG